MRRESNVFIRKWPFPPKHSENCRILADHLSAQWIRKCQKLGSNAAKRRLCHIINWSDDDNGGIASKIKLVEQ